jgi:hypothetical protein
MKKPPITLIIIAAIFALFIGLIVYIINNSPPNPYMKMTSRELAKLCLPMEGQVMHIHPHLTIVADKQMITLPAGIGIDRTRSCMTSLHTHDASGIIHVESPIKKDFTLGDFFAVWNKPLSSDQILDYKVDQGHGLKFYVDGKESTEFENVLLQDHQELFIDYFNLKDGPDEIPEPAPGHNGNERE